MSTDGQADRMIGESAAFLQMQEQISRLAPLDKPVLVIGERGTGKELVAARLHYLSKRWEQTRAAVLRNNSLCAWCLLEGRITAATVVDHIVDLADGGAETDYRNLRALCWACHSRLTRIKQDGGTPPEIPACTPPEFTVA